MIKNCGSIFYDTLEELNATYQPDHPDVLRIKQKYGTDIQFSRIMHEKGVEPRFELYYYKIEKEKD